ncbi:hypothetical protein C1T31_08875 [Hanstruepera neustonica]|uniref:Uncharacterized protein n=2 Tax=Hanstruepera neustonica TaxID=1445657 RepID=A0A2K1DYJ7_9FLAO|nr:hypothetical protein C1T31_08875 [Hanstruepera neustonica]
MGQDPMLQKPDLALDEQAKTLTKEYDAQLGLTSDQLVPFEIKVEEFLIRKEKIENRLEGREKLEALAVLREQEYVEMQNILTQPQLNVYKRIRPSIQPLDVVEKPKK